MLRLKHSQRFGTLQSDLCEEVFMQAVLKNNDHFMFFHLYNPSDPHPTSFTRLFDSLIFSEIKITRLNALSVSKILFH